MKAFSGFFFYLLLHCLKSSQLSSCSTELFILFIYVGAVFQHSNTHCSLFTLFSLLREVPVLCPWLRQCPPPQGCWRDQIFLLFTGSFKAHTWYSFSQDFDAEQSDSETWENLAIRFTVGAEVAWNPTIPLGDPCSGSCCLALGTFLVLVHWSNLRCSSQFCGFEVTSLCRWWP